MTQLSSPSKKRGVFPDLVPRRNVQGILENELMRLKARFGLAGHLNVIWQPETSPEVEGFVRGSTVYVFSSGKGQAIKTLRHEFIEYILTEEFLNPRLFEAMAHRRSDALVDIIAGLI